MGHAESTGCPTDSPSHRNTRGINNSRPQSPCSPLQPANSTTTLTLIPSSGCSAPSIALDPQTESAAQSPPASRAARAVRMTHRQTHPGAHTYCPHPITGTAPSPLPARQQPTPSLGSTNHLCPRPRTAGAPTPAQQSRLLLVSPY